MIISAHSIWKDTCTDFDVDVLDVSHLEEPRIEKNVIDMLVMKPEGNKQMIKAICEIYGGSYGKTFSSDFIQGKGEGQILLLHGPPGTGKTLTAGMYAQLQSWELCTHLCGQNPWQSILGGLSSASQPPI